MIMVQETNVRIFVLSTDSCQSFYLGNTKHKIMEVWDLSNNFCKYQERKLAPYLVMSLQSQFLKLMSSCITFWKLVLRKISR